MRFDNVVLGQILIVMFRISDELSVNMFVFSFIYI